VARYQIVPDRSRVWIDARSNVHPIHSATDGLEGFIEIELDADGHVRSEVEAAARLSLAVSRLSSGNRLEDRELQKRIDAKRFPTIQGVLGRLDSTGHDGTYRVSGDITFLGVARHHEDDITVKAIDEQTIRLAGASRFDIRDFGMQPPRVLVLRVEPEVDVRVDILAEKEA
jgi:polyisoprenoid-binding protein YceI